MRNEYIAPVDHGTLSATGSVAAGAAGGALKGVGKMALWTVGVAATVGLLWGAGVLTPLFAAMGAASTATGLSGWGALGGLASGAVLGSLLSAVMTFPAALVGGGKGVSQAHSKVQLERGAAREMEMQVAAYQAMAASNDNKYNFPSQGSRFNPALASVQAVGAQGLGTLHGQQLQRG